MTVYTIAELTLASISSANAAPILDTINKPANPFQIVSVDFEWSPRTSTLVTVGSQTFDVWETPVGEVITFIATPINIPRERQIVNYGWKFGDGGIFETGEALAVHTYSIPNYQCRVSLTVTDDLDNTYSMGRPIYLVS